MYQNDGLELVDALVLHYRSLHALLAVVPRYACFHGFHITFPFQKHMKKYYHHFYVIMPFSLTRSLSPSAAFYFSAIVHITLDMDAFEGILCSLLFDLIFSQHQKYYLSARECMYERVCKYKQICIFALD